MFLWFRLGGRELSSRQKWFVVCDDKFRDVPHALVTVVGGLGRQRRGRWKPEARTGLPDNHTRGIRNGLKG